LSFYSVNKVNSESEIAGTEPARQWKTLRPEGGRQ
jgi:hypothetical protein